MLNFLKIAGDIKFESICLISIIVFVFVSLFREREQLFFLPRKSFLMSLSLSCLFIVLNRFFNFLMGSLFSFLNIVIIVSLFKIRFNFFLILISYICGYTFSIFSVLVDNLFSTMIKPPKSFSFFIIFFKVLYVIIFRLIFNLLQMFSFSATKKKKDIIILFFSYFFASIIYFLGEKFFYLEIYQLKPTHEQIFLFGWIVILNFVFQILVNFSFLIKLISLNNVVFSSSSILSLSQGAKVYHNQFA